MSWIQSDITWCNGSRMELPLTDVGNLAVKLVFTGRLTPVQEDENVLVQLNGWQTGYLSYTSAEGTLTGATDKFLKGFTAGRATLTGNEVSTATKGLSLGRIGVSQAGDYLAEYTISAFYTGAQGMQRRLGSGYSVFGSGEKTSIRATAFGQSPPADDSPLSIATLTHLTLLCDRGGSFTGQVIVYKNTILN